MIDPVQILEVFAEAQHLAPASTGLGWVIDPTEAARFVRARHNAAKRQAGTCVRCTNPAAVVAGKTLARCEACRAKRKART